MWKPARQLATMSAVAAALPTAILAVPLQQIEGGRGPLQSAAIERFAGQIAEDVARDDIGGITAGVFVGGETVWARGFGWADRERRLEADNETIYRVGSISKSFTAVVMAQLAGQGVLDIDAPARSFLPELDGLASGPDTIAGVTLRRLASHTAGLVREPRLPEAAAGPIAVWQEKILASIPTTSFLAAPGETYSYSNIGFGILGLAISRAAGQSFMTLVTELIFEPLAMDRTMFIMTPELYPHLAVGYSVGRDGTVSTDRPAREHWGRGYKVPNGGIYSTVRDLARFAAGITGASAVEILPPAWRVETMRIQTADSSSAGYGLGFSIHTTESGLRTVGHGGSVAGYNAHLVFDPETTVGVVLLRNYNGGSTNLARRAVALLEELVQEGVERLTR